MTMVQFLSDTKLFPGTAHDISMYSAKLGIAGALQDILNNHPNDQVALIPFNRPQFTNDPAGVGAFTQTQIGLGRNYAAMINGLWYPPNSGTNDVRPWDANDVNTPRAYGDYNSNTTTVQGFMLAYNQLSGNTSLQSSGAGGWGRKGSQRMVVLETDGMANWGSSPANGFTNLGVEQSYYRVLPGDTINSAGFDQTALLKVVQAIANKPDGTPGNSPGFSPNPGYPGYSLGRKPVQIHTLAFGAIFESTASGTEQASAVALLQKSRRSAARCSPARPPTPPTASSGASAPSTSASRSWSRRSTKSWTTASRSRSSSEHRVLGLRRRRDEWPASTRRGGRAHRAHSRHDRPGAV